MKHISITTLLILSQLLLVMHASGQILICTSLHEAEIQANGLATVLPSDVLEGGSNPMTDLQITISTSNGNVIAGPSSSVDISCFPGSTLTYQVTHVPSGNACWGNLEIADPNGNCTSNGLLADEVPVTFGSGSLSGPYMQAVYLNGEPLRQYDVNAFAINTNDLAPGINTLTFDGVRNSTNGVSTLDLVLIQRHLTDLEQLSPIASIRADVDRSEFLGSDDLVQLRRLILGQENNTTKYFALNTAEIPADFDEYDFPGLYDHTFDASSLTSNGLDFEVHQPGDVNFSSNLRGDDHQTDSRSTSTMTYTDREVYAGETITLPITIAIDQPIAGLQFGFTHQEGYRITAVTSAYSSAEFDSHITDEEARISYVAADARDFFEAVLTLDIRSDGMLGDMLEASETFMDELVTDGLSTTTISLEAAASVSVDEDVMSLLRIHPTVIDDYAIVTLPEGVAVADMVIYDNLGRLISKRTIDRVDRIHRSELGLAGIYIVQMSYSGTSHATRVIAQ